MKWVLIAVFEDEDDASRAMDKACDCEGNPVVLREMEDADAETLCPSDDDE